VDSRFAILGRHFRPKNLSKCAVDKTLAHAKQRKKQVINLGRYVGVSIRVPFSALFEPERSEKWPAAETPSLAAPSPPVVASIS
jgi:hypothetical protein